MLFCLYPRCLSASFYVTNIFVNTTAIQVGQLYRTSITTKSNCSLNVNEREEEVGAGVQLDRLWFVCFKYKLIPSLTAVIVNTRKTGTGAC